MYLLLFALGLAGIFIFFFVAVCLFERQPLCDFVPIPAGAVATDSPYFNEMNAAAARLGFTPAGVFTQNRNSAIYQARGAVWISPERQILLYIAGGKTAKVPIKRTILISVLEPKNIFQTQDEFGIADLSGLTHRKVILGAHMDELLASHRQRFAPNTGGLRMFSAAADLADWKSVQAMKAQQLARLGLIKFLNSDQTVWRYTIKGSWLQFSKGLRGQLAEAEKQRERVHRKRPGAA